MASRHRVLSVTPVAASGGSALPRYRSGERAADRWVHIVGIGGGIAGATAVGAVAAARGSALLLLCAAVYAAGLLAMLGCSELYNLAPPSPRKEFLRRLDHAAIFAMIAGTYVPFALGALGGTTGLALVAGVGLLAAGGIAIKLLPPRCLERLSIAVYLLLGWSVVLVAEPVALALSAGGLSRVLAGGALYSAGVGFHLWRRLPFHNALWHGFILAAAACHYAAVMREVMQRA